MASPAAETLTYTLGRTESETRRLLLQARIYHQDTHRFLSDAGIVPGMKVLDLGSGPGDVAFIAADIVGQFGEVVGIDMNPAVLGIARSRAQAEGRTNVTFVEGDCRAAQLPNDFDAAIGRLVLMYTGDVAKTMQGIVEHVRPGGVVAFMEAEFSVVLGYLRAGSSDLLPKAWEWADQVFRQSGAQTSMAPQLFQAFVSAGLGVPQMELRAPMGGSDDWIGYEWAVESMRSILPLLEKYDITTSDEMGLDTLGNRVRTDVNQNGYPFMLIPMVTAWANKPLA
jgi:ubiquinone/menaquinone biosynthesis C-methylase UbiE